MICNAYNDWDVAMSAYTTRKLKYNNVDVEEYLKPLNKHLYREVERNFVCPLILDMLLILSYF